MNPKVKSCVPIALALSLVLCCLSWAGESMTWSTLLAKDDEGSGIAIDGFGNAYVTGHTGSADFPTTAGAFDIIYNPEDGFVAKLNASGSALVYSTFLGGSDDDVGGTITLDGYGNAYVTGWTWSADFPTTAGAFDTTHNGNNDAFVAKLNASGSALLYSTFLGGSDRDVAETITLDVCRNVYVSGHTQSSNFPTTSGAFDTTHNGAQDIFVTKLDTVASNLIYSTFLGGSSDDIGCDLALGDSNRVFVTGYTESAEFPTTAGAFDTSHNGSRDALVSEINSAGSALIYSTYLGGSDTDQGSGVALDGPGNAYIHGSTSSSDFPTTPGAFDSTYAGGTTYRNDVFVTKLNAGGDSLIYSTYLGGSNDDGSKENIAVDGYGNAYITGLTKSSEFPTTAGAFDTTHNGSRDVYVVKLNAEGSALEYSTFLGGSGQDLGQNIAIDGSGNAYLTGCTASSNFPTTAGAFDTTYNGGSYWGDAFVAKLDATGSTLFYSTYLGGGQIPPVVLASFQAVGGQGFIELNWVTASEINCHKWEVYRGQQEDGEYLKIGELSGHGCTDEVHTYQWIDHQVRPEVTYFYKLREVDFDGGETWSHVVSATAGPAVPKTYALSQNYPNPFNANTQIRYQIPKDSHVTLKIYNIRGQEVRSLVDAEQKANWYMVLWDGRNDMGQEVASDLYFCRLKAGEFSKTIKMVLVK